MPDEDDYDPPGLDGSRFAVGESETKPLKPGRSVDKLTDAERKENDEHDEAVKNP